MDAPKRKFTPPPGFGGRQEGAGRKPKPPSERLHQINLYVDAVTAEALKKLPRARAVSLKRQAASILQDQVRQAVSEQE